jgi:hypothetical protein
MLLWKPWKGISRVIWTSLKEDTDKAIGAFART